MAKRRPMGEGAADLFGNKTAADMLTQVAGGTATAAKAKGKRAQSSPVGRQSESGGPFMVTTVRITGTQWKALRDSANERVAERGGGKADASEILRDVLDAWIQKGR